MKVLWVTNNLFAFPAEKLGLSDMPFGGWAYSLAKEMIKKDKELELCIASPYSGNELNFVHDENTNISYFVIPVRKKFEYETTLEDVWKEIIINFKPEIIHLHGTEFSHALPLLKVKKSIPAVVSIQGIVSLYADVYNAGITNFEIFKNLTLRDMILRDSIFQGRKLFYKRGISEKAIFESVEGIIGRTDWDHAYANTYVNDKNKYYHCDELLRPLFYQDTWNVELMNRHTIYLSQSNYPIKGLHIFLKALTIVKQKFPDIRVRIAGHPPFSNDSFKGKLKMGGYGKIIAKFIKDNKLEENITFLGIIGEEKVKQELLSANVFVSPSIIENSSNALCEALILGVPAIASNVGGTSNIMQHKKDGLTYPVGDYRVLAYYIELLFNNDEIAKTYSAHAIETAKKRHNRDTIVKSLNEIYENVINTHS